MTLGLYVVRRLGTTFGLIALVFFGMLLLFETVELLRRFGGSEVTLGQILWLALLRVPATFYQILPLLVILASMGTFLGLARSSELVVMRAAGRSAMRVLREPFLAAMLLGVLAVTALNPLVAAASRAYHDRLAALQFPDLQTQISLQGSAVWMRQGEAAGQTVIRAQSIDADGLGFSGVSFLLFDRDTGLPLRRIEADSARLEPGLWRLGGVKLWDLQADNPERTATQAEALDMPSDLTGERIRESLERAGLQSVWTLPGFIAALDRAGLSSRAYRAQFLAELAQPLLLGAMLMVGAVLCFHHVRAAGVGLRMLATVLAGFVLFFLRNFAQILGENGQIPLWMAIWTPPVASMMLAIGLLLHLEDG